MLQYVQHQNERKLTIDVEALTECADVNSRTMLCRFVDQIFKWFDTLDVSKFQQTIKEQTVTATHIQNSAPAAYRLIGANSL